MALAGEITSNAVLVRTVVQPDVTYRLLDIVVMWKPPKVERCVDVSTAVVLNL